MMALAEQRAGRRIGFANRAVYAASKRALRDVVPSAHPPVALAPVRIVGFDYAGLTIHTAPGFDDVTGLGVPDGEAFLSALQ
jgi:hypothetical protein